MIARLVIRRSVIGRVLKRRWNAVAGQPHKEQREQRQGAGSSDRGRGQVAGLVAGFAHAWPEEHDKRERRQRDEPGGPQQLRQYRKRIHQPLSSSAWSTSTV